MAKIPLSSSAVANNMHFGSKIFEPAHIIRSRRNSNGKDDRITRNLNFVPFFVADESAIIRDGFKLGFSPYLPTMIIKHAQKSCHIQRMDVRSDLIHEQCVDDSHIFTN